MRNDNTDKSTADTSLSEGLCIKWFDNDDISLRFS